jgi:hypothetical protein
MRRIKARQRFICARFDRYLDQKTLRLLRRLFLSKQTTEGASGCAAGTAAGHGTLGRINGD